MSGAVKTEDFFAELGIEAADVRSGSALGRSKRMRELLAMVERYARSDMTVMVRGESGSGKEVVARLLHHFSDRADRPLVALNCAALSETVLESELFGHEKGAFTGAVRAHQGRFERAAGGTLFLDEIGDISPAFQLKLLRVLQEGEFERVGGTQRIKTDARIVTATNRDLEEAVRRKQFRLDLYYRLNVATISVPPLRERPEDIKDLVRRILQRRPELRARIKYVSEAALDRLAACRWPGNVRELENCILRAAAGADAGVIEVAALSCTKGQCFAQKFWGEDGLRLAPTGAAPEPEGPENGAAGNGAARGERRFVGKVSRARLQQALERSGWIQARAGRLLGLTPRQIRYAVKRYGIELRKF